MVMCMIMLIHVHEHARVMPICIMQHANAHAHTHAHAYAHETDTRLGKLLGKLGCGRQQIEAAADANAHVGRRTSAHALTYTHAMILSEPFSSPSERSVLRKAMVAFCGPPRPATEVEEEQAVEYLRREQEKEDAEKEAAAADAAAAAAVADESAENEAARKEDAEQEKEDAEKEAAKKEDAEAACDDDGEAPIDGALSSLSPVPMADETVLSSPATPRREQERAPWDSPSEWAWHDAHAEGWAAHEAAAAAAADQDAGWADIFRIVSHHEAAAAAAADQNAGWADIFASYESTRAYIHSRPPVSKSETPPQRAPRRVDDPLLIRLDDLFGSPSPKKHRAL